MFVYWGYRDSGKAHMKHYAKLNNKTSLLTMPNEIRKIKTTTHINEITWTDETIHRTLYHDLDGFRHCDKIERRIWKHHDHAQPFSTLNPKIKEKENGIKTKKNKIYSEDQIKKYTQKEYINTEVYFDIIAKYNKFWGDDGICKPLTHDTLKNHYDEILDGVDLLLTFGLGEGGCGPSNPADWFMDDLDEVFRNSVNIVPYKSNIFDSVVSKLDHYRILTHNDLFEDYKKDPKIVWSYLDFYIEGVERIKDNLKQRNIPFQMFDLDTDSYPDTFGWQVDVDRKFTHRQSSWNPEIHERVKKIAEHYITMLDVSLLNNMNLWKQQASL